MAVGDAAATMGVFFVLLMSVIVVGAGPAATGAVAVLLPAAAVIEGELDEVWSETLLATAAAGVAATAAGEEELGEALAALADEMLARMLSAAAGETVVVWEMTPRVAGWVPVTMRVLVTVTTEGDADCVESAVPEAVEDVIEGDADVPDEDDAADDEAVEDAVGSSTSGESSLSAVDGPSPAAAWRTDWAEAALVHWTD